VKRRLMCAALALGSLTAIAPAAEAQYFGKNHVQYDRFHWHVIETEHFLVHYYPEIAEPAQDAARMAERAYGRLSRLIGHEFREKKPIILFATRGDFGQNNVTGDLGEGTAGVTEGLRHRVLLPFTGDYASFEQVLMHELVHSFQYDLFARGRAGAGLQTLAQVQPPLWLMEGTAQYFSIGPDHVQLNTTMRDAAINGNLPTVEQMTLRPDRWNPYHFGHSFMAFIGAKFGDQAIGGILSAMPSVGVERAFRRETGRGLEELADEWREELQNRHLPGIAGLERPRRIAQPVLSNRRSGGEIFLAPALSDDGRLIAFLSNGSFARGEVFIDLWLADARTGRRIRRLVKSTFDPDFEELRILYSQSSFSPDGRMLAFTAMRQGRDILYLLDVARGRTVARVDPGLKGVTSPTWSPDGRRLAFSGQDGGYTDLYVVDVDGKNLQRLTRDRHSAVQPAWSPDGRIIAFVGDRGPDTDFELLRFNDWNISLYHVESGQIEDLPGQAGHNANPVWSPDGRSLAYVTDRTGVQNLFLYDLDERSHYQLTNFAGGITAFMKYSPTISWARGADKLAFTYYDNGNFTIWSIDNPRLLRRQPMETMPAPLVADGAASSQSGDDSGSIGSASASGNAASFYRTATGFRPSGDAPGAGEIESGPLTVAALLDSAELALPDAEQFREYRYRVRFSPDYVAQPSIGYTRDNFGRGVYGGTTIIFSDLLGNNRMAFSAEINGRVNEARAFAGYTHLARRLQYMVGFFQEPFYFAQAGFLPEDDGNVSENVVVSRYVQRELFGIAMYPFNRFTRVEAGARLTSVGRTEQLIKRIFNPTTGQSTGYFIDRELRSPAISYVQPYAAYVADNTLWGINGPIMGRRFRLQVEPTFGRYQWMEYLADYRRYDPIIFNTLTIATRGMASISMGRDADSLRKYIGYSSIIRGYEGRSLLSSTCAIESGNDLARCSPVLGSRVAVANVELRFPLVRRADLGGIIALPPIEGLVFYDAGVAWFGGQDVRFARRPVDNPSTDRALLTSHGFGVRVNLYNFAVLRWDYAIPHAAAERRGFWRFSFGPNF
jgi:Tol biopolymer transport system component